MVEVQGEWCEEPSIVKNKVKEFSHNRLRETRGLQVKLEFIEFPSITLEDNGRLTKPITKL